VSGIGAFAGQIEEAAGKRAGRAGLAGPRSRGQGTAAREWLADRKAELLPVPYFHLVYTMPGAIAGLAYQNKAAIYDILFKAAAKATLTIAADPKWLGAKLGMISVTSAFTVLANVDKLAASTVGGSES
jgi:hypothetical protein